MKHQTQTYIVGKLFSDHPNGGTIFKDVKGYVAVGTVKSMKKGTINGLVTNFETAFGRTFAKEYHEITDILSDNKVSIGGFELNITYHEENIEIEFPQILIGGNEKGDKILLSLHFYHIKNSEDLYNRKVILSYYIKTIIAIAFKISSFTFKNLNLQKKN